jgi:hypothetical protein
MRAALQACAPRGGVKCVRRAQATILLRASASRGAKVRAARLRTARRARRRRGARAAA